MKILVNPLLLFCLLQLFSISLFAQQGQQQDGFNRQLVQEAAAVAENLSFESKKPWESARWFVVGKWVQSNGIRWLGGNSGTRVNFASKCLFASAPFSGSLERSTSDRNSELEILRFEDWVAIEVSPNVYEEEFLVKARQEQEDPECQARVSLTYAWKKNEGRLTPLLFLTAQGNRFFGYQVDIRSFEPEVDETADIQMDLMLGVWSASLPNAANAGNKRLLFAPVATARGQWLPYKKHWGLSLALEQAMASHGGFDQQKAQFSDWQVGSFGEYYISFLDALQLKLGLAYRQHLADHSYVLPSFLTQNKDAKYLLVTSTMNLYFSKFWLMGLDFDFAFPGRLAGRGVTQSYVNTRGTIGYRTNSFLILLLELGLRSYKIQGYSSEKVIMGQAGIRIDL